MKIIVSLIFHISFIFCFSLPTHATLINRGVDTLGNSLIYDDNLDITWYDFTNLPDNSLNQMSWASSLSVNFGGAIFSDWRLPRTLPVNGTNYQFYFSCDGTTDLGFNIQSPNSEMAYLYYMELDNKGYYDEIGNIQPGWGLINTGPFTQLRQGSYWSSTECETCPGGAWGFDFFGGGQATYGEYRNEFDLAIAVRDGDVVTPVPDPSTIWLFSFGLIGLVGLKITSGKHI